MTFATEAGDASYVVLFTKRMQRWAALHRALLRHGYEPIVLSNPILLSYFANAHTLRCAVLFDEEWLRSERNLDMSEQEGDPRWPVYIVLCEHPLHELEGMLPAHWRPCVLWPDDPRLIPTWLAGADHERYVLADEREPA